MQHAHTHGHAQSSAHLYSSGTPCLWPHRAAASPAATMASLIAVRAAESSIISASTLTRGSLVRSSKPSTRMTHSVLAISTAPLRLRYSSRSCASACSSCSLRDPCTFNDGDADAAHKCNAQRCDAYTSVKINLQRSAATGRCKHSLKAVLQMIEYRTCTKSAVLHWSIPVHQPLLAKLQPERTPSAPPVHRYSDALARQAPCGPTATHRRCCTWRAPPSRGPAQQSNLRSSHRPRCQPEM